MPQLFLPNLLFYALLFVFGTAIGSFLNVVILRLPAGETLGGRSHCPNCHHQLAAADLVPVLSYALLGGKCRYCHHKISPRYAAIELATGVLFVATAAFFPVKDGTSAVVLLRALVIVSTLVPIFVIDLEHYVILDKILLVSGCAVLLLNLATPGAFVPSLIAATGALAFFWTLYAIGNGKFLGLGDVKLGLFLGLATPGALVAVNIFLAYLIGAAVAIPLLASGKKKLASEVPFGTFLAISTVVTLYVGPQLLAWYIRLVGV